MNSNLRKSLLALLALATLFIALETIVRVKPAYGQAVGYCGVGRPCSATRFITTGPVCLNGPACTIYISSNGTDVSTVSGLTVPGTLTVNGTAEFGAAVLYLADINSAAKINLTTLAGTAGSGTGITVNATATVRHFVHKITVAETALTAAALTQDVTIWTVNAKTRLLRIVADATTGFTGGGITAMTVQCGSAAGGTQYLPAGSIFAAATLGDVAAEIGAGLTSATVADIPSFSGTTAISCRFTSTTANVVAATAGSVTFYIEGIQYP